jgi:Tfp pilus assembly protein PilE
LERFRTEHINTDPKLSYLPYFKHSRRQQYAKYLEENAHTLEKQYNTDERKQCFKNSKKMSYTKKGFNSTSD